MSAPPPTCARRHAGGDLSRHWRTEGNWKLADGTVTLRPREGERGWARFGAYLWLLEQFGDFEIEFDYKLAKGGNSGFYFHVGDTEDPVAKGIEVQIYDSHARGDGPLSDHDAGGIIPGIAPTANRARPAGEWSHFHVVCRGKRVIVELNGGVMNEVRLDHPRLAGRPARGSIGFQDHAMPLALRRIRIRTPQ